MSCVATTPTGVEWPPDLATVRLVVGPLVGATGDKAYATVEVKPPREIYHVPSRITIMRGVYLRSQHEVTLELPACDDPALSPTGFTYEVSVGDETKIVFLPAELAEVHWRDLISTTFSAGQVWYPYQSGEGAAVRAEQAAAAAEAARDIVFQVQLDVAQAVGVAAESAEVAEGHAATAASAASTATEQSGLAQQSANNAATSATDAAGAAGAAQTAQTAAQGYRDAAAGSATAAGESAGAAASSADTAAGHASDAGAALAGAADARDATLGYRDTAADHATTATEQAGLAVDARILAESARDATLAAASNTYIAAGRPDIPSTTPYSPAQLAAMPSGTVYRSTDGPQGAWEWMKQGTTWVVTQGDTGWIDADSWLSNDWTGALQARIVNNAVEMRVHGLVAGSTQSCVLIPSSWWPGASGPVAGAFFPSAPSQTASTWGAVSGSYYQVVRLSIPRNHVIDGHGQLIWTRSTQWPTTLPGTPA